MLFDDWDQLSTPTIRPATPSDVPTVARLHVDSWRSTCRGILPDDVLDGLSYADRERTWMQLIAGGDSGPYVYVAEHPRQGVIGFIAAGPERSEHLDYTGEVYALYVDQEHQGGGLGRTLLQYIAQVFAENAHRGLLIWSFTDSPSNGFFQHLGAEAVTTRSRRFGEATVEETAFGWADIGALLGDQPVAPARSEPAPDEYERAPDVDPDPESEVEETPSGASEDPSEEQ